MDSIRLNNRNFRAIDLDLIISISTSGKSPALAKRIRKQLNLQFGREYGEFLLLMGRIRKEVLAKGLSQEENSRIFHELVDSPILDALREKNWDEVASNLGRILKMRLSTDDISEYLEAE